MTAIDSPTPSYLKEGVRIIVSFIWALGAVAMAFVMAPSQAPWETLLAVCIAAVAAYLWSYGGDFWPTLAACPLPIRALSIVMVWRLLVAADDVYKTLDSHAFMRTLPEVLTTAIGLLAGMFVVFTVFWAVSWLWQGLKAYLTEMDFFEVTFLGTLSVFLTVILYHVYRVTNGYWASVDVIFSLDSGLVSDRMLPDPTYADLRHPLYAFLFWPLDVWLKDIASLTSEPVFMHHLFWGILSACMLLWMALLLYRLSGRQRHVPLIYIMTMPVWLFFCFVEKYQPACLLSLLTVAALAASQQQRARHWGLAATGCMASSAPLLLVPLLTPSPRQFIRRLGALLCAGFGLLAVSGRLHILLHLSDYWQDVHQFTKIDLSLIDRVRCYFSGVYACFFPLAHRLYEGQLFWKMVGKDLRLMGIVILIVALIGFFFRRKERAYRIFFAWLIFQPLFVIVFAWSPLESPLFALYFSWAIVPLFCAGIYGIFARFPRLFTLLVTLFCCLLLALNVPQWLYILSLLRQLMPVS